MIIIVLTKEEKQLRIETRREELWNKQHKNINGIDHKQCNRCLDYKPATEEFFYKNKTNKIDGLYPYCVVCSISKMMQWKKENPEQVRKNDRQAALNRKIYDPDYYRRLNRSRVENGKHGEWIKRNPEKAKVYGERAQNKKHKISTKEWIDCKDYFNNSCAYCELHDDDHWKKWKGEMKLFDLHKEHVYHDGSNDLSNCVPACQQCNSSKHDFIFEEWYNEFNEKYDIDRYNKIKKWINEDYKQYIEEKKKSIKTK